MKKTDEQLANELDLFLTARLNGQPLPTVSEELISDIAFVDDLLKITAQVEPKEVFLSDLKAHLAVEASEQQQKAQNTISRPEQRPKQSPDNRPFWENIILLMKDKFTMKRTVFALGAIVALFVFAFMAWTAFQGSRPGEPGIIVESTPEPTVVETAEPVEVAALPTLPSLSNASGLGGGFGGGGGGDGTAAAGGPELGMRIFNPLSGTQFILNTTLPIEPTNAVVYQQPAGPLFSVEDVPGLAAMFGLNGPIYTETYYIEEGSDWTPTPVYQVFDGSRSLAVGDNYLYYYDEAGTVYTGSSYVPMPYEQAVPIAEAFLQQTGLIDFEYRLVSQNGFDIAAHPIIDGREAIYPVFQLAVNDQGQIWSFSYNPINQLTALGNYPLRSAESAWQYMLDNGVDFQSVFFNTYPTEVVAPEPVDFEDGFQYWTRSYEPGEEVTLYAYPGVFTAVNGDAPPRILLNMFTLNGPADQLEAIAPYVGKQILVHGIAGEKFGYRQNLELVSWEPIEREYTFREGTVQISDGQKVLVTNEDETIIIQSAPADLNEGQRIYISGWIDEGQRGQADSFNWQDMGVIVDQPEIFEGEPEPLPVDSGFMNPFGIQEVTIDEVNLQYAVLSVWDEMTQTSAFFMQPVWQFKGLTDSGDIIEIYVQAVATDYVSPPAQ